MDTKITRRTLIMGTASLGASIALGSALTSCANQESATPDAQSTQEPENDPVTRNTPTTPEVDDPEQSGSRVYFTTDISQAGLLAAFRALDLELKGNVAVKLTTGEPGGHNFLQPEFVKGLVDEVSGTIIECNTAYGGRRSSTQSHYEVAADHGFTAIADVDIMDAEGETSVPVVSGTHLPEVLIGSHHDRYDTFISLAHFKGHSMGGFGGAIKNISIGMSSAAGKLLIHTVGISRTQWQSAPQDSFLESMAEATKAIWDDVGGIACVNVMNRLSVDCDCDSNPAEPDMADIGILASLDPVALDQACVDLIYAAPDGASVVERIESRHGIRTLEFAEEIGLGSRAYELVTI